jgi:hypothetical protein
VRQKLPAIFILQRYSTIPAIISGLTDDNKVVPIDTITPAPAFTLGLADCVCVIATVGRTNADTPTAGFRAVTIEIAGDTDTVTDASLEAFTAFTFTAVELIKVLELLSLRNWR